MRQPRVLRATEIGGAPGGRGVAVVEDARERQKEIPCGNDNKKNKGKRSSTSDRGTPEPCCSLLRARADNDQKSRMGDKVLRQPE